MPEMQDTAPILNEAIERIRNSGADFDLFYQIESDGQNSCLSGG
jgi:hypothetical protein